LLIRINKKLSILLIAINNNMVKLINHFSNSQSFLNKSKFMKTKITTLAVAILFATNIFAQTGVSISVNTSTPDPSAMLDIQSDNKGLLIPRITIVNLLNYAPIEVLPENGLMVYNESDLYGVPVGFYYWAGSQWNKLQTNGDIWTKNGNNVYYTDGNVGIGTTAPNAILDVQSTTSGFIPPRMTKTQKNNIASPTNGMIIYQTDDTTGLYVYNNKWELLQKRQKEYYAFYNSTVTYTSPVLNVSYDIEPTFRLTIPETGVYDIMVSVYFYIEGTYITPRLDLFNYTTNNTINYCYGEYIGLSNLCQNNKFELYCFNEVFQAGDVIGIKITGSGYSSGGATVSEVGLRYGNIIKAVKKD